MSVFHSISVTADRYDRECLVTVHFDASVYGLV